MKKKFAYMASAAFLSTSLFMTSCGGNNGDMPTESTEDNRETGVDGTGDLPGTGADDTTNMGTDTTMMGTDTTGTGVQ